MHVAHESSAVSPGQIVGLEGLAGGSAAIVSTVCVAVGVSVGVSVPVAVGVAVGIRVDVTVPVAPIVTCRSEGYEPCKKRDLDE